MKTSVGVLLGRWWHYDLGVMVMLGVNVWEPSLSSIVATLARLDLGAPKKRSMGGPSEADKKSNQPLNNC